MRKRCIKDKFQVQLAILKSPRKRLSNLTDNDFANFFKYHIARFMGRKYIATEFENVSVLEIFTKLNRHKDNRHLTVTDDRQSDTGDHRHQARTSVTDGNCHRNPSLIIRKNF